MITKKKLKIKKTVLITVMQISIFITILTMNFISFLEIINNKITLIQSISTLIVFFVGTVLTCTLEDFKANKMTHETRNKASQNLQN